MSRIGKKPVPIPQGVKVSIEGQTITVTGPKGTLTQKIHPSISVAQTDEKLIFQRKGNAKEEKALHGLNRTLVANMVKGVTQGYQIGLLITGMGYRVSKQKSDVVMSIGFSHPVVIKPVEGIALDIEGTNKIVVKGTDKQLVGQVAAQLRMIRPPDNYKGKGVLYEGERLKLKPGKAGKGAAKQ